MIETEWTIYPNGKLMITRICPMCSKFLEDHPSLHTNIIQKQKKDGSWYHTSKRGRTLHRLILKIEAKND